MNNHLPISRLIVCVIMTVVAPNALAGPPNIVYILADDLGLGDVRSYTANSPVDTPNIDRIAASGMRFTNAHSPSAVCTPTRYGILTGQYAWRTSLKSGVLTPYQPALIDPNRITVAEMLHEHGYTAGMYGKWHLGMNWTTTDGLPPAGDGSNVDHSVPFTGGPVDNGFDDFYGNDAINYPPYAFIEDNLVLGTQTGTFGGSEPYRFGPRFDDFEPVDLLPAYTERAVQFVNNNANGDDPFFMYMPLSAPHSPIVPPDFIPQTGTNYDRFILTVDWAVGQVLDALEANGIDDDTIVLFASDNGVSKNYSTSDSISSGFIDGVPLRGQKADIWEAGHRIPFMVRWDGQVQPGATSDEYVELVDFFATAAEIVGQSYPPSVAEDSYSLVPVLTGETLEGPIRAAGVNHSINGTFAIRQTDANGTEWKLIFNSGSGGWTNPVGTMVDPHAVISDFSALQLYNMTTDVGEQQNLLADGVTLAEQQQVLAMQDLLRQYIDGGHSTQSLLGDLNGDEAIDETDWGLFKAGFNTDMSGLSPLATYVLGDLNGDLTNDFQDFTLFRNSYDAFHGLGSLQKLVNSVPEPASVRFALLAFACISVGRGAQLRPPKQH
jgi:arylsulfatase A